MLCLFSTERDRIVHSNKADLQLSSEQKRLEA